MNHRIFERTLRLLVFREACLFECHLILNLKSFFVSEAWMWRLFLLACFLESAPLKCISGNLFVVRVGVIIICAIVFVATALVVFVWKAA